MRLIHLSDGNSNADVSINAPREGCDHDDRELILQSLDVSIHAPREGCDGFCAPYPYRWRCFNSRTPGGVRLRTGGSIRRYDKFQFTHPGRGATQYTLQVIKIH